MSTDDIEATVYEGRYLKLSYAISEQHLYIDIESEFDAYSAPEFDDWWKDTLNDFSNNEIKGVIFTLDHISFVDSSGLRSLLSIHRRLVNHCPVLIARVSEPVMQILEITGLNEFFGQRSSGQTIPSGSETPSLGRSLGESQ